MSDNMDNMFIKRIFASCSSRLMSNRKNHIKIERRSKWIFIKSTSVIYVMSIMTVMFCSREFIVEGVPASSKLSTSLLMASSSSSVLKLSSTEEQSLQAEHEGIVIE